MPCGQFTWKGTLARSTRASHLWITVPPLYLVLEEQRTLPQHNTTASLPPLPGYAPCRLNLMRSLPVGLSTRATCEEVPTGPVHQHYHYDYYYHDLRLVTALSPVLCTPCSSSSEEHRCLQFGLMTRGFKRSNQAQQPHHKHNNRTTTTHLHFTTARLLVLCGRALLFLTGTAVYSSD